MQHVHSYRWTVIGCKEQEGERKIKKDSVVEHVETKVQKTTTNGNEMMMHCLHCRRWAGNGRK
jgi:hypothetical protein